MMLITENQRDALNEIVNIGFGRAANALSILVGQRIILLTPQVSVFPINSLEKALQMLENREMTTVHQVFSGKLSGDIMLLMDTANASKLVDMLAGGKGESHPITQSDRESLVELGNIILNSFIGSFGNLLNIRITFTVPHLQIESVKQMLRTMQVDQREVEYALIIHVDFRLVEGDVGGYVVIVMGIESLEAMFESMRMEGYLIE